MQVKRRGHRRGYGSAKGPPADQRRANLTEPAGNADTILVRIVSRYHPAVLVAAVWAAVSVRLVRRRLKTQGLKTTVPRPPKVGPRGGRGVRAAMARLSPTCLERALVSQAWLTSVGIDRDVVIGVPPDGMKDAPAHAWVDGTDDVSPEKYLELHRLPPRPANPARGRSRVGASAHVDN